MARALLPLFGGSAGVWVTCMLFFQVMLLLGYLYSWAITNFLSRAAQSIVHTSLLALSLTTLSLKPRLGSPAGDPLISVLAALATSIGLPYFLLSTTSPLLQSWFAKSNLRAFPYWLFALSNAASLLALLAYPVAIEPSSTQSQQWHLWTIGYICLVVLACAAAMIHWRRPATTQVTKHASIGSPALRWIALSACASALWMAVANHLSQEVAPVPLLWVLPLSIYLLSFILCFESDGWYRPALFRWLLPAAWIAAAWRIAGAETAELPTELAIFSLALFIWCMFCHGEIARTKPIAAEAVTFFYLMIATGGALGALFTGIVAPNLLSSYLELPIGIAVSVLLALYVLYGMTSLWRLGRISVVAAAAFVIAARFQAFGDVVHLRNFYGALRVTDSGSGENAVRSLYNGRTLHGIELLARDRASLPTAYYGRDSGAGGVLSSPDPAPRRVGLIGLGIGTLAAYGRAGDTFRFYEINPAVIEVATRYFHFLANSRATTEVIPGDGRLSLEREPANSFDVIVLDAFADDTIPVHLLTREAFVSYFHLLKQNGILAIHLTNRYLELAPVVEAEAQNLGQYAVEVYSPANQEQRTLVAEWALISGDKNALEKFGEPHRSVKSSRLWTDDYSNLFQVLK